MGALWSNECVGMSDSEVDEYPALTIQLDGVKLEMVSRDYLLQGSPLSGSGEYCLGISDGGDTGFIIGATTMRNYYVIFDQKDHRIGWGRVNTETCGSMSSGEVTTETVV